MLQVVPHVIDELRDLFAAGVLDFDVTRHRPHPPGFPGWIAIGKLLLPLAGDPVLALQIASSLASAVLFWAMANGFAPVMVFADNPYYFIALILLTPLWTSFHFYWVHRALHWPPLYRLAHALHHRNTNVGPWSGLSMHPIEHVIFFSSILIHVLIPSSPFHILFHMQHQSLTAATSHTGYEAVLIKDKKYLALGTFHHQMHHRYFDCNYGNLEMPWDKWFGSFHNGTEDAHARFKDRKRLLLKKI